MKRKLTNLSFNMLIAFEAVCRLNSTTKAALELNIVQPAVSRHLKTFADIIGHELFTRTSTGLEPTEKGIEIWKSTTEILDLSERLILDNTAIFNPINNSREFAIGIAWLDTKQFVKNVVFNIHDNYPLIKINTTHVREGDSIEKLQSRNIDLYLGVKPENTPSSISYQDLIDTNFCVICSAESTLFKGDSITKEEFINTSHLKVYYGSGETILDKELRRRKILQKNIIEAPDIENLLLMLRKSDYLFVLTEQRANALLGTNTFVKRLEPKGFSLPKINICQMWNTSHDDDTAKQWLRNFIHEKFT